MNNMECLLSALAFYKTPNMLPEGIVAMIACPYEAVEDPDETNCGGGCIECKRKWLSKEVREG